MQFFHTTFKGNAQNMHTSSSNSCIHFRICEFVHNVMPPTNRECQEEITKMIKIGTCIYSYMHALGTAKHMPPSYSLQYPMSRPPVEQRRRGDLDKERLEWTHLPNPTLDDGGATWLGSSTLAHARRGLHQLRQTAPCGRRSRSQRS